MATRGVKAEIDWDKAQKERDAGVSGLVLAKKYGVSDVTIYKHTRPGPNGRATRNGNHNGGASRKARRMAKAAFNGYASTIAELEAKRDKLSAAIEALQELGA